MTDEKIESTIASKVIEDIPAISKDLLEPPKAPPMKTTSNMNPNQQPVQKQISLNDIRVGYIVGVTKDNLMVFELLGQDQGLMDILGLHQHAGRRINSIYEDLQVCGDRLTHEVGRSVQLLNNKMDELLAAIRVPQRVSNKIK